MSISLGPYNAPVITKPYTLYDMYNNKENFNNMNKSSNNNASYDLMISPYLEKHVKLWIWDWDDTLINISAYMTHSMNRDYILSLSDKELEKDIPNWVYFKNLCEYLVSSGRRVGIASFGTYTIIRAYMDRIFGFNQKIFTEINIYASCRDIGGKCGPREMHINKNAYIQRLMKHYTIDNPKLVVLFDDKPSNIADAARMGVIPIQINIKDIEYLDRNYIEKMRNILFGPYVMMDLERRIRKLCQDNPVEYDKQFGQLGDFKVMKQQLLFNGDIVNRTIEPNFNLEAFKSIKKENKNEDEDETPEQKKLKTINKALEGFDNHSDYINKQFNNNDYISQISDSIYGLFSDYNENDNTIDENFSTCMSCQSQTNTWVTCIVFLIMIGMIVTMFYIE
jgi:hypothetical protein